MRKVLATVLALFVAFAMSASAYEEVILDIDFEDAAYVIDSTGTVTNSGWTWANLNS